MKAIKLLATSALLIGAAGMVVPGIAAEAGKPYGGHHHAGKGWHYGEQHPGHLARVLELTDAQKATLKSQREADQGSRALLHEQLKAAHTALNDAVVAGANDAELNSLAEVVARLQTQKVLAGAKSHQTFLAVLTDEQKQTLSELKSKRMERKGFRKETRDSKAS